MEIIPFGVILLVMKVYDLPYKEAKEKITQLGRANKEDFPESWIEKWK